MILTQINLICLKVNINIPIRLYKNLQDGRGGLTCWSRCLDGWDLEPPRPIFGLDCSISMVCDLGIGSLSTNLKRHVYDSLIGGLYATDWLPTEALMEAIPSSFKPWPISFNRHAQKYKNIPSPTAGTVPPARDDSRGTKLNDEARDFFQGFRD